MALDYDVLMGLPPRENQQSYTRRDTILYALGVGAALDDPTDPAELKFVYEEGLQALPTMAVVLGSPGFWMKEPQYGIDWKRVLHGEQFLELHDVLPVEGVLRSVLTIDDIVDKGAEKGAVLYSSRKLYDAASGRHLATLRQSGFLRGNGGFGGKAEGGPKPKPVPERVPDLELVLRTRPEQALLYRLSGDYNPLHADPAVATDAGFPRPILHGLCTYGVAGRAVLKALCANDASRLKRLDVRFSSPAFPGETFVVEIWHDGDNAASFRVRVQERNVTVLNNGYAEFV